MSKLPELDKYDKTLVEIDKAIEIKKSLEAPRNYLGMSQIGDPCWRKLFYSFRNAEKKTWMSGSIKATEDGFEQEKVMAIRLRMLPYIELHTEDINNPGKQISFSLLLGHFRGHCDCVIRGILEAPKTWHIWEHKSVNEKKFNNLEKLRQEKGEKQALSAWDETYFAQAQIYMHESKLSRHYLTVTTPGGRKHLSVRTEYNKAIAEGIITKAKAIIFDSTLPARISEKREYYKCQWCEYKEICHDGKFSLVNCRTCISMQYTKNGEMFCTIENKIISDYEINCKNHIYLPALVLPATFQKSYTDHCIYWYKKTNFYFSNGTLSSMPNANQELDGIFTSQELREKIKYIHNLKKENNVEKENKKQKKAWD